MPPLRETPAGYQALIDEFSLSVMPLPVASFVRTRDVLRVESSQEQTVQCFPASYAPEPTPTA